MDIYREAAARIYGVSYDSVTDEQRKFAKLQMYRDLYNIPVSSNGRTSDFEFANAGSSPATGTKK